MLDTWNGPKSEAINPETRHHQKTFAESIYRKAYIWHQGIHYRKRKVSILSPLVTATFCSKLRTNMQVNSETLIVISLVFPVKVGECLFQKKSLVKF